MATLTKSRVKTLERLFSKIVDCEGGQISIVIEESGKTIIQLLPDIPYKFWCDKCKERYKKKNKLIKQWTVFDFKRGPNA